MNLALEFGSFRTNFSGTVAKCSLNASANSIGSFTEFPSTSREVKPEGLNYIIYLLYLIAERIERLLLDWQTMGFDSESGQTQWRSHGGGGGEL